MPEPSRSRRAVRRACGAAWLLLWLGILHLLTNPWRTLGGLVPERLRWLEWVVVPTAVALGFTAGSSGRDSMEEGSGRAHADHVRLLLYPPLMVVAAVSVGLDAAGDHDTPGVVVTALASFWLGTDVAFGILPLLRAQGYSFKSPLDPGESGALAASRSAQELAQKARIRRI